MLESLLAYSELKLGPTWGPAVYELVTSLVFIVATDMRRSFRRFRTAVSGRGGSR